MFDNDRTRVLEVLIDPGQREPTHSHRWPSVMLVDRPARIRYYTGDTPTHTPPEQPAAREPGPGVSRGRGAPDSLAFGYEAASHPPLRGWLVTPVCGDGGRKYGLLQLSDKTGGADFDERDEELVLQLVAVVGAAGRRP